MDDDTSSSFDGSSSAQAAGNKELRKMVAFIMQEAGEKSREIQVKADEEFNIEKAKLVQQERQVVELAFERRMKQAEVRRKMYEKAQIYFNHYHYYDRAESNQVNRARLRVLQAQDQAVEEIVGGARERLQEVPSTNGPEYEALLVQLMLQAFYRFMDGSQPKTGASSPSIVLQVREADMAAAKNALPKALSLFHSTTSNTKTNTTATLSVRLDEQSYLDPSDLGGLIAIGQGGRIRLSNTLTSRLGLAVEGLLPVMRAELFGPSSTRRFFS